MAYVVSTKRGTFEVRESRSTPAGPRSRTLATFRELTEDVVEKAQSRSTKPLSSKQLRIAARRQGAAVESSPSGRAARELIAEIAKGRQPNSTLRHMLLELLRDGYREGADPSPRNEAAHAVAEWMAATPEERGNALIDLLLLADALPHGGRRGEPLRFPRLESLRP